MIDKDLLIGLQNGEVEGWDNPVWLYYQDLYNANIRIDYDYAKARDLMREEGYWGAETPDYSTKEVIILDLTTVPKETIIPSVPVFVGLGFFGWLRKRKKKDTGKAIKSNIYKWSHISHLYGINVRSNG